MNDCKYGYSVKGTDIGLTMLKCGTSPDYMADKGKHLFTYSLFAHSGVSRDSKTNKMATLLNNPPIVVATKNTGERMCETVPFIAVDKDNVLVETVKKAEDGNGYIIRLYETLNKRTNAKVSFGFDAKEVHLVNLIEEEISQLDKNCNSVDVTVKPFEIITLRVVL
jgi:alpha-mannosidase